MIEPVKASGKCSRCEAPFESPAKMEFLASGMAQWCAGCWASEMEIRGQVRTTGCKVREGSRDFEGWEG